MRWVVVAAATGLLLALPAVTVSPEPSMVRTATPAAENAPAEPDADAEQRSKPKDSADGRAKAAVEAAEQAAGPAELAVAVLDRRTGHLSVGTRGTEAVYTASLSKVVLAVDMLDRRRLEGLVVDSSAVDLLRRALGPSDDSAMSALWGRFDGPGAAARVSKRLGLVATTAPRESSQWGEMSVSATDMVRTWRHILEDMPPEDRDLLLSAMDAAPDRATDGFDQAFGLLAPEVNGDVGPGAVAKQGWMCCFSGEYYLHSSGAVGDDQRYLVALLARIPRGPGWEAARADVTAAATKAVEALEQPPRDR